MTSYTWQSPKATFNWELILNGAHTGDIPFFEQFLSAWSDDHDCFERVRDFRHSL